jgi:hypothetical protein
MPAIKCTCGNVIRYGQIPCPDEFLFISDVDYDKYTGLIDAEELYRNMKSILQCGNCKRLWVYWNGFKNDPQCYRRED